MLPKVRLVFDRKKRCANGGVGDVEVYVYYNNHKRYLSTGVQCHKREYRDGVVSLRSDAVELNKRLQWCVRKVQDQVNAMTEKDDINLSLLTLELTDRNGDFWAWCEDFVMNREVRPSTLKGNLYLIKKVRNLNVIKTFADVCLSNIEKIDREFRSLKPTCRRHYHTTLNLFIKVARKQGLIESNPYDKFEWVRCRDERKLKYLTEAELERIKSVSLSKLEDRSRDIFLLGVYTGLRYSDIIRLSISNLIEDNGVLWLKGVQQKTRNEYAVVLSEQALAILDKRQWKMKEHPTTLNLNLKSIAAKCGIHKQLTMHMSRHTFATRAISKGVRMEVVSKMLGHTDIKMTQLYAKVLNDDVIKGFELLSAGSNVK